MSQTRGYRFRYRNYWLGFGWLLIGLVVYLSLSPDPEDIVEFAYSDKIKHLLAYGVLMGWFAQLYPTMKYQLFWALVFCLLGVAMEFGQGWGGQRTFDVFDMLANGSGVWRAVCYVSIMHCLDGWRSLDVIPLAAPSLPI